VNNSRLQELLSRLAGLSESQITAIDNIIQQFERPITTTRNAASDLVSECVLRELGDTLQIHHCFSAQPFTKDKFEYALERSINACDGKAVLSPRGNPGDDIAIDGVPFSLKTQADASIKVGFIHISKFMELGKGEWSDNPAQLDGLRASYLHHMESYERILTLRHFKYEGHFKYELVEIPKALLLEAKDGTLAMMTNSTQMPKPGTCTVVDAKGKMKFQLYFDGGGERKLQVRHIDKTLCTVHAEWTLSRDVKITEASTISPG
jgi:type II restriction enzyme